MILIALYVVGGVSVPPVSLAGLGAIARWRTEVRPVTAVATIAVMAAIQLLAFRISLLRISPSGER